LYVYSLWGYSSLDYRNLSKFAKNKKKASFLNCFQFLPLFTEVFEKLIFTKK